MLHIIVATALKDVGKAHQIGVDIGVGVLQRIPHAGLGGQVNHPFRLLLPEQRFHSGPVGHILADLGESRFAGQARQARFLESRIVVIIDVIHANDFVTAVKQPMRQMGANKPRRTRYQNFQSPFSLFLQKVSPALTNGPPSSMSSRSSLSS